MLLMQTKWFLQHVNTERLGYFVQQDNLPRGNTTFMIFQGLQKDNVNVAINELNQGHIQTSVSRNIHINALKFKHRTFTDGFHVTEQRGKIPLACISHRC